MAMHQLTDLQAHALSFVVSIGMSVTLGIAVILLGAWNITYGGWRVTEKASAMGLAISGAHFLGMFHAYSDPVISARFSPPTVEVELLAVVLVALSSILAIIDRQLTTASGLVRDTQARMVEAIESVPQWFALFDADTVW